MSFLAVLQGFQFSQWFWLSLHISLLDIFTIINHTQSAASFFKNDETQNCKLPSSPETQWQRRETFAMPDASEPEHQHGDKKYNTGSYKAEQKTHS